MKKITRNFLDINSISDLISVGKPKQNIHIKLLNQTDFQLSKFLYKQIGKKYFWFDRLIWTDKEWIKYISNPSLYTYVLYVENEVAGYFEIFHHKNRNEIELTYLGLLEEYIQKKLGGYLLSEALKISWSYNVQRVWVHTCSLDHPNAIKNYLARGMKVFKNEVIFRNIA